MDSLIFKKWQKYSKNGKNTVKIKIVIQKNSKGPYNEGYTTYRPYEPLNKRKIEQQTTFAKDIFQNSAKNWV